MDISPEVARLWIPAVPLDRIAYILAWVVEQSEAGQAPATWEVLNECFPELAGREAKELHAWLRARGDV